MEDKELITKLAALTRIALKPCTITVQDNENDALFPSFHVEMDEDGTDGVKFFTVTKYANMGMVVTFCPEGGKSVSMPIKGETFFKWAEMYGLLAV